MFLTSRIHSLHIFEFSILPLIYFSLGSSFNLGSIWEPVEYLRCFNTNIKVKHKFTTEDFKSERMKTEIYWQDTPRNKGSRDIPTTHDSVYFELYTTFFGRSRTQKYNATTRTLLGQRRSLSPHNALSCHTALCLLMLEQPQGRWSLMSKAHWQLHHLPSTYDRLACLTFCILSGHSLNWNAGWFESRSLNWMNCVNVLQNQN